MTITDNTTDDITSANTSTDTSTDTSGDTSGAEAIQDATIGGEQPARRWTPRRIATWAIAAVIAAVVLMYAAIFFYATVLNDAPDQLDGDDLSAALVEPELDERADLDEGAPAEAAGDDTAGATAPAAPTVDGVWVPTDASEFGYRVDEVLSGVNVTAVGRSNEIEGALTIDGTTADIDVTVQVADIRSDNGSRDSQFRNRIMDAEEFPTARFVTTAPIEFGTLPEAGEQVSVTATGDLTLRGVTRSVTFDVTAELAATDAGDRIGVLGNIPIVFDDFGIPEPSIGSVSVEDNGLIEFVLVFTR